MAGEDPGSVDPATEAAIAEWNLRYGTGVGSQGAAAAQAAAALDAGALFGLPRYSGTNAIGQPYSNLFKPGADFMAKRTQQAASNENITNAFKPGALMPAWAQQQAPANYLSPWFNAASYFPGIRNVVGGDRSEIGPGTNLGFGTMFGVPAGTPGGGGGSTLPPIGGGGGTTPPATGGNTGGWTPNGPPASWTGASGAGVTPAMTAAHQAARAARGAAMTAPQQTVTTPIDQQAVFGALGITNPQVWTSPTTNTNYNGPQMQWSPGDFANTGEGSLSAWQQNWNALPPALRVAYGEALGNGNSMLLSNIYGSEGAGLGDQRNLSNALSQANGVRYAVQNGQLVQVSVNEQGQTTTMPLANLLNPNAPRLVNNRDSAYQTLLKNNRALQQG
jgi:hypothetical protein